MAGRDLRFAIVGAGMSGLLCAIKLREAGFDDFTIYEKADRVGGTASVPPLQRVPRLAKHSLLNAAPASPSRSHAGGSATANDSAKLRPETRAPCGVRR